MGRRKKMRHHVGRNRHHLVPKSRGGSYDKRNLLLFDATKHKYWHMVFGNRTLSEVIELLLRIERAKQNQTV
jgi:hypothetical protein